MNLNINPFFILVVFLSLGFVIIKGLPNSTTEMTTEQIQSRVLEVKLDRILREHPEKSIREDFYDRIFVNHEIVVDFKYELQDVGASAAFMVFPSELLGLHTSSGKTKGLMINSIEFMDPTILDERWQFVLFHESIHERQYNKGKFSFDYVDPAHQPQNTVERRRLLKAIWHGEREAHKETCRFANRIGIGHVEPRLCRFVDTKHFDRVLSSVLIQYEGDPFVRQVYKELGKL